VADDENGGVANDDTDLGYDFQPNFFID